MELCLVHADVAATLHRMAKEDLALFAKSHRSSERNGDIEVHIFVCLLLFRKFASLKHLEESFQLAEAWASTAVPDNPDRGRRFDILSTIVALSHPPGAPKTDDIDIPTRSLHMQAMQLLSNFDESGRQESLREAAELMEKVVAMRGNKMQPRMWSDLEAIRGTIFESTGSIEDLDSVIEAAKSAVDATSKDDPEVAGYANNLGVWLGIRFERTGAICDIDQAVDAAATAVEAVSRQTSLHVVTVKPAQHHPDLGDYLGNLGNWLWKRFEKLGKMQDLDGAIDAAASVLEAVPKNHANFTSYSSSLANRLGKRFERTGDINDLNRAIEAATRVVETIPDDHLGFANSSNNLGIWLGNRFERAGSMDDLDRAIDCLTKAVQHTPETEPDHAMYSSTLGVWLGMRFGSTDAMEDLNRAIHNTKTAADKLPEGHPDRPGQFNNLGAWLGIRFERTGVTDDLTGAIEAAEKAVELTPEGDKSLSGRYGNLGNRFGARFKLEGEMGDIDRAVDAATRAVQLMPEDHNDFAGCSNNLGYWLGLRYDRTKAVDDLDRAINAATRAVKSTPPDHPSLAGYSSNLAAWLGARFTRNNTMEDLNRAIDTARKAVDLSPCDHPMLPSYRDNLGVWLGRRFDELGAIADLDQAIMVTTEAVGSSPLDNPDRSGFASNLGSLLGTRFDKNGEAEDLDRAIEAMTQALDSTPPGHADLIRRRMKLGYWLGKRFERKGEMDDQDRQLSLYEEGRSIQGAPPHLRIKAARLAAEIHISREDWTSACALLDEAILLLPKVSQMSLENTITQETLGELQSLASVATSVALNAGKTSQEALRLLDFGRSVIIGLVMDKRMDALDLGRAHLDLAEQLTSLRNELDLPTDNDPSSTLVRDLPSAESQRRWRRKADKQLDVVLERVRSCPGFETFLQPPTAEDLMSAAEFGPLIVLIASSYRCDAFLVQKDSIRSIELTEVTLSDISKWEASARSGSDLMPLLEWLWRTICRPCLDALDITRPSSDGKYARVWWVPTGLLSQLPLHAAGIHGQGSLETVLDRVMSSYASSITGLLHGRQRRRKAPGEDTPGSALLVSMENTCGASDLPFASHEVEMLKALCPSLGLTPASPAPLRAEVLSKLKDCTVFHYAGHARYDASEPSRSCLLLEDWKDCPLTVQDLRKSQLQNDPPFLAYMSVSCTGADMETQIRSEGVPMVSAMQLAGFRHVIGTLWGVSDRHCVDVARVVYETLRDEGMTDMSVCIGLHRALRMLRDMDHDVKGEGTKDTEVGSVRVKRRKVENVHWIPYAHFGV